MVLLVFYLIKNGWNGIAYLLKVKQYFHFLGKGEIDKLKQWGTLGLDLTQDKFGISFPY